MVVANGQQMEACHSKAAEVRRACALQSSYEVVWGAGCWDLELGQMFFNWYMAYVLHEIQLSRCN